MTGQVIDSQTGAIVDPYAFEINEAHRLAKESAETAIEYAIRCGKLLVEKKATVPHGEWEDWIKANCTFSCPSARNYMKLAKSENANALAFSTLREALGYQTTNHLAQGTGQNEWYTPSDIADRARRVLGGIDLDPASNDEANEVIKAGAYFSAEDDGLEKDWTGSVWLNPPYSRDLMPKFVGKLISEYEKQHVDCAVLVSHNNTETEWFQSLAKVASAICFPAKRIKFYRGEDVAAPVNGQVFFYLGEDRQSFIDQFGDLGVIVEVIHGAA